MCLITEGIKVKEKCGEQETSKQFGGFFMDWRFATFNGNGGQEIKYRIAGNMRGLNSSL